MLLVCYFNRQEQKIIKIIIKLKKILFNNVKIFKSKIVLISAL